MSSRSPRLPRPLRPLLFALACVPLAWPAPRHGHARAPEETAVAVHPHGIPATDPQSAGLDPKSLGAKVQASGASSLDEYLDAKAKKGKTPSDYLYRQRAHPKGRVPAGARAKAARARIAAEALEGFDDPRVWQPVGPTNIGGRVTDIAVHPTDPDLFYAAFAEGGVLRTTDGGASWTPLLDRAPAMAAGCVTLDPTDPQTIWVGTGEVNPGGGSAAFPGTGILRSTDGGDTWRSMGLEKTRHIGRIVVDPTNPDRIFAAAMGALYSTNPERGLYRSLDGGWNWERVLFVNDSTGCIDVAIDPQNPQNLLAATWERIRRPDSRRFGGPGSRVYRSTDGGDTWFIPSGLPGASPRTGRIGVTICAADPRVQYVVYADNIGYFDGLYKTTDGGDTWFRTNDLALYGVFASYGWWFGNVRVSPSDPDRVFVLGLDLMRSTNGGSSWRSVGWSIHVDHHGLEFFPGNPDRVVLGNDGGVYVSTNGGGSWSKKRDLPVTQFYTVDVDESDPHRRYGGTQDNGTIRTYTGAPDEWEEILGGDGFYVLVDPTNPAYVYAEYQYGNLFRSTNGGSSFVYAKSGIDEGDRHNWNCPLALDPSNPSRLYFGTHRVYRSTNRAVSWTAISGDLTKGPGQGNLTYGTVTTIAVSPTDGDYIYAGTDDGNVAFTRNGGADWIQVGDALPDRWVTRVTPDPVSPETFYVTLSGFKWDESAAHVYRTTDGGVSWTALTKGLPDAPVNDLVVDPANRSILYAATDVGVYVSSTGGSAWRPMGRGLPVVVCTDLRLEPNGRTLTVATFGRSMWAIALDLPVRPDTRRSRRE